MKVEDYTAAIEILKQYETYVNHGGSPIYLEKNVLEAMERYALLPQIPVDENWIVHYEALQECCNKLLDVVDSGGVPKKDLMGLRILLNR